MKQFFNFVVKETRHILRDKRTMLILFGMPLVMMLLFGFAISTDVREVRTLIVGSVQNTHTRQLVDRINCSSYFTLSGNVSTPAQAELLIRNQQADVALVFTSATEPQVQVICDAADPNMALQYQNYISQIVAGGAESPVITRFLYNPSLLSAYNFVPGIMGMLLMLICALMTSISIVREKETGTMEVLLASPARPLGIILAKAVPYLLFSIVILVIILLLSFFVLRVPLSGSLLNIFIVSLTYIFLSLSLGLLISNIARTQLTALLISAMVLMMPCIMLSGLVFPIESMPAVLQVLAHVVPATYYIAAIRKLMIMGVGFDCVLTEWAVLAGYALTLLCISLLTFKKQL